MNNNLVIAIIPIRSGSSSIKNKNVKMLNEKPLASYVINEAIKSKIFDKIVVASDNKKYFKILKKYLIKNNNIDFFFRNKKNSTNRSSSESVLLEVLNNFKMFKVAYLIQATSPLLKSNDLVKSLSKFRKQKNDSLLSVYNSHIFLWKKISNKLLPINYNHKKRTTRQEMGEQFVENGAFYIFNVKKFLKIKNRIFGKIGYYKMNKYRSYEVDELEDFNFVELLKKKEIYKKLK